MFILVAAYLGGVLTILSPCVLPVLPFVFARSDRPFRSHGLPMLLGLALAFAAAASLATVAAGWVETASAAARYAALAVLGVFGLSLWSASVADRLSRPLVGLGARLTDRTAGGSPWGALVLGVGTGLLWTPCAGPILGLLLTGAALDGALTPLLLLAYALGACTSLAIALRAGGSIAAALKRTLHVGEWLRRAAGAAVLVAVAGIALGLDTRVLARTNFDPTVALQDELVARLDLRGGDMKGAAVGGPIGGTAQVPPLPIEGTLPALDGAIEWINSPPLTAQALRGKVVLVDFWTYSCINCLRTLPYLRAWADKYRDQGLVVLGVHTPEFAFERKADNVRRAVKDLQVGYPVAVDSQQQIWRAFDNLYWPALYFVDAQGRVRHHVFGEGDYVRSERVIQQLLRDAGSANVAGDIATPAGNGTQAAPADTPALSQETYVGRAQARGFVPSGRVQGLRVNQWTLVGAWRVDAESAELEQPGGRIAYRFRARDLHLVLGTGGDAKANAKPVRFRVSIDGHAPGADHGSDTDAQGDGTIDGHRLYQLVRQRSGDQDHLFEIEFLDAGATAYAFTFG